MGDLQPFWCQGCGDRFDVESEFRVHVAKHSARDVDGNRLLPLRSVAEVCERSNLAVAIELAAKQARELARDIGLDADDAEGLERAVRESAEGLDEIELAAFEADTPAQVASVAGTQSCSYCESVLDPSVLSAQQITAHVDVCRLRQHGPSVLDELELALRSGGILTLGAAVGVAIAGPGSIHAILETDDGGRFAQCKGADLLGVLLELVTLWKHAPPKPPPQCLFCSAPLEGTLVGQHMNVGHSVPLCVAFGTERTRMSCIPPHAVHQLLATEIRKRKAAAP